MNGELVSNLKQEKGYAVIERNWEKGDKISIDIPMPVRCVSSNPNVISNNGQVAVERGPIVYCAEEVDNGKLDDKCISLSTEFTSKYEANELGGIMALYQGGFKLIPYYSWGNRGANQMKVWFQCHK